MKFLALIASVAAIKVDVEGGKCVSMKESNEVFKMIDTNGNGQISKHEMVEAVTDFLDHHKNIHPTKKQIKMFEEAAIKDAGADHQLNPKSSTTLPTKLLTMSPKESA